MQLNNNNNYFEFNLPNKQIPLMQQLQVPSIKVLPIENNEGPIIKNHSAVIYQHVIYLFGGYNGKTNHKSLYSYNILKGQWDRPTTTGSIPEGRNGHTCTLIKQSMYLIGGWLGSSAYSSEDTYVLDLEDLVWKIQKTQGKFPGPCNMHSADAIGGRFIYVFRGGDGQDYLNDLHRLDTETLLWEQVKAEGDLPPARANHGSAVLGRQIFIFGGWNGTKRLNDLYQFDVDTNSWSEILLNAEVMPAPRAGMSMCAVKNTQIYLFGGSGANSSCFNDIYIFDLKTKAWEMAAIIDGEISSRTGHSMTAVDDKLVIIGGSMGSTYQKDFFMLEIDPAPPISRQDGLKSDSKQNLLSNMSSLYQSELLSDIKFRVKGETFCAHKIIISLLCEHFRNMFSSGMREQSQLIITYEHMDPHAFEIVLYYLYTGEVVISDEFQSTPQHIMQVFKIADMFLIDDIQYECEVLLLDLITKLNFMEIYQFADKNFSPNIIKYCEWFHNQYLSKGEATQQHLMEQEENKLEILSEICPDGDGQEEADPQLQLQKNEKSNLQNFK